jgi:replicative DNA helicase
VPIADVTPLLHQAADRIDADEALMRERGRRLLRLGRKDRIDADEALMRECLEALMESVDLVENEYKSNWRHGVPTRARQLDATLKGLEAHQLAIFKLRARFGVASTLPRDKRQHSPEPSKTPTESRNNSDRSL